MTAPSGQQFELAHGDLRAVVTEVGAGLRAFTSGGRDRLDGFAADEMCRSGRGQLLAPWPNRIAGGSYVWEGQQLQLPLNEVAAGNAIHGLVRWSAWGVGEQSADRILLAHRLHPQPGYPFELELSIEYTLGDDGLTVVTTAANPGSAACPFGAGAHPYLTLGVEPVDSLELHVPAAAVLESNERGIPVGASPVEGTEYDFREPRPIGATVLDHAFTALERGADGRARASLATTGERLELWVGEGYTHLMVFTGDPLPDVNRRAVAIEPMSCPPNAFQTGDGVVRLDPGDRVQLSWGLQITHDG